MQSRRYEHYHQELSQSKLRVLKINNPQGYILKFVSGDISPISAVKYASHLQNSSYTIRTYSKPNSQ